MNISANDRYKPSIALVGGGVHAVVVADCIQATAAAHVVGYSDVAGHDPHNMRRMAIPLLGDDAGLVAQMDRGLVDALILGLAGLEHGELRRALVRRFEKRSHRWWSAIHPRATISTAALVSEGVAIFAGAVVNALARIGRHCVINTGAIIEHHAIIEDFAVISPHATLCGCTHVGEGAFVGAGAVVLTGVSIGVGATVGAGAIVRSDVPDGATVVGNPARNLERPRRSAAAVLERVR
jgi:sugar O-acyltransferase (sialic acid O-acetyltransferase NeuD family)